MNKIKDTNRVVKLYGTRAEGVHAVSGIVHVIRNEAELPYVREGEILVAERICDSWRDQLVLAKAIIEDASAVDSIAQQLAAEYDVPAVVGVSGAMELRSGDIVTLYGDGEIERVYEKRAPDSPMRVSVPAAVAARKGHGIITAPNVVPFSSAKSNASTKAGGDVDGQGDSSGKRLDDHKPASGD